VIEAKINTNTLSIVVLNWNDYSSTINCVNSILNACNSSSNSAVNTCTLYVVDNNSSDESPDVLKRWVEENDENIDQSLVYLQSYDNLGYAGGNNLALRKAYSLGCDYYLVINNDAIVTKGSIDELLFSLSKGVDIVGPAIVDPETGKVQSAGKKIDTYFGKHTAYKDLDVGLKDVGYVSGACIMFTKRVIDKISFLEESYFIYTEDIEYCLRAKNNNLKVACNTNVHIFHSSAGAIDTRYSKGIRKYYQTRNNVLMAVKYFKRPHALIYIVFMLVRIVKNSLLFLWRGNFFAIHMCFYGFYDGIRLRDGKIDTRKNCL